MRFLFTIAGIASLGLAALLCAPLGRLVWQEISFRRSVRDITFGDLVSGSHSHRTSPSEMVVSVGRLTLFGWRLWAAAGTLLAVGALFVWLGVYALSSQNSGS